MKKTCQSAAILKDGKLLIVRRVAHDDEYASYWELPGGGLDEGETWEEGLCREVLEETGLTVEKIGQKYFDFSYCNKRGIDVVEEHYLCSVQNGDVVLEPEEHDDYKWISNKQELEGLMMTEELQASCIKALQGVNS